MLVFLALVAASFYYERYEEAHRFKTAAELTQWLSVQAVSDAEKNSHITLDFTPESIQKVETILGSLHDHYVKNPKSISANGLGSAYGAYIGEVIRRTEKHARWERDDPVAGEKSYPIFGGADAPIPWPGATKES